MRLPSLTNPNKREKTRFLEYKRSFGIRKEIIWNEKQEIQEISQFKKDHQKIHKRLRAQFVSDHRKKSTK